MEDISGKDLKQFFYQWLYVAGHPVLKMNQRYDNNKKQLRVTIVQQQPVLFEFPLTIGVNGINKNTRVKDRETTVVIDMKSPPSSIILDPGCDLLFE